VEKNLIKTQKLLPLKIRYSSKAFKMGCWDFNYAVLKFFYLEGDRMSKDKFTWFGIKLSRKRATQLFILSFAGVFFLVMTLIPVISSLLLSLRNATIYGDVGYWFEHTFMYMVPYFAILLVFLIILLYSASTCRWIAQSYSDVINPQNNEPRIPMFCPNCGNKRTVIEKFCRTCGEEFK
jgi:hypothetical protein